MIPFQFAGILACLLIAIWGTRRLARRQRPRGVSLLGMFVGVLGMIAIYDPELTTRAARVAGIERGADLLTYLIALAFLGSWFYFYQRIRALSTAVTILAREMAIQSPRRPSSEAAAVDDNVGSHAPDATRLQTGSPPVDR